MGISGGFFDMLGKATNDPSINTKASYSYGVFPPFQQRQLLGSVLHNCPPIVNTGLLKFLITVPYKIPFRMEERSKTLEESQGI